MKWREILLKVLWLAGIIGGSFQVDGFVVRSSHARRPAISHETIRMAVSGREEEPTSNDTTMSRRAMVGFATTTTLAMLFLSPAVLQPAQARYIIDDDTGAYIEIKEEDWQTTWKQRLDKAQTMSKDDIFAAARGAGTVNLTDGNGGVVVESDASKKRRAMSACRDAGVRQKAQAGDEKECTARVFGGQVDFLLNAL
jgi:hypothetical protein